jgi:thiamine-monophosphate kinase
MLAGGGAVRKNAEDVLLERLLKLVPLPEKGLLGPGDDCAAIPCGGDLLLLKTDCVAEGVHFTRDQDPSKVGWKALCRPLSDLAAMGGVPGEALITFFSPPDIGSEFWVAFYRGIGRAARKFGVTVAGGEMSCQPAAIAVSVMVTGRVSRRDMVKRSGASSGDFIFVTGRLGGAGGRHHLNFIPRLKEGRWIAMHRYATAMMDLSDGLGADLPRLARASACGFEIDKDSVPRRRGCDVRSALSDGEDYELLFTCSPKKAERLNAEWKQAFPKTLLTRIGRMTHACDLPSGWPGGWDHFSDSH